MGKVIEVKLELDLLLMAEFDADEQISPGESSASVGSFLSHRTRHVLISTAFIVVRVPPPEVVPWLGTEVQTSISASWLVPILTGD